MQLADISSIPDKLKKLAEAMAERKFPKGSDPHIRRDYSIEDWRQIVVQFFASMLKVLSYEGNWKILKEIKDFGKAFSGDVYNLQRNLERLQKHGLIKPYGKEHYSLTELGERIISFPINLSFYLKYARRGEQNMVLLQLLVSGKKSFSELKKELPLNVGSLHRNIKNLEKKLGFVSKEDRKYQISNKATLESLKELCNEIIQKYWKMMPYFQDGELKFRNLSEEPVSLPATYGLEYFTLRDVINDHIVVTYSYESESKKREEIVRRIIYEQTRWKGDLCKPILPEEVGRIQIAYNINQLTSLHQLFNLFCLHAIKSFDRFMVEQIEIPEGFLEKFDLKPRYGIRGVRELLKVDDRPLLHVVIPPYLKDKVNTIKFVQQLFEAGVDAIGDHQFMGLGLAEFQGRIEKVIEVIEDSAQEFSHKMLFYPYIEGENFMEKIDTIKDAKCRYLGLGLSPLSFGIPTTIFVRKNYHFPLHLHLTLHGIYTRMGQGFPYSSIKEKEVVYRSGHGININVILKLFALCGGDEVNVDYYGYYSTDPREVETQCGILQRFSVFPALVGGIGLDNLKDVVLNYGKDLIIKIGGGRFLERERQIKEFIGAYKELIENTMKGKFEESERIKKWQKEEREIRDKDQVFLIGVRKEI